MASPDHTPVSSRSLWRLAGVAICVLVFLVAATTAVLSAVSGPGVESLVSTTTDEVLIIVFGIPVVWLVVVRPLRHKIRHQQTNLDAIAAAAPDGILTIDEQGKIVCVNAAAERMFGYTAAELSGRPLCTLLPPLCLGRDHREAQGKCYRPANLVGSPPTEIAGRCKDGESIATEVLVGDVTNGRQSLLAVIVRDCTERKLIEERLRLQATAIGAAATGIVITDRDGAVVFANPAFTRQCGYTLDELVGKNLRILKSGQQDQAYYKDLWSTVLAGRTWVGELINRRKDGSFYVEAQTITPVCDRNGHITHFVAVKSDITECKKAEQKVRESQRALVTLLGNLPGMAYRSRIDRKWTMEFVSDGCRELTEFEPFDLIENHTVAFGDLVHPDDRDAVWATVQEALKQGRHFDVRYRIRTANGAEKWVSERGCGVRATDGRLEALEGFIADITWEKQAEETLRQSHARLEQAVRERTAELTAANRRLQEQIAELQRAEEALERSAAEFEDLYDGAPCGYHSLDANGFFVRINKTELAWLGYTPEELIGRKSLPDLMTPESRHVFEANFATFKERGEVYDLEFTLIRKDGGTFDVVLNATAVRKADGTFVCTRSTMFDITERKKAHDALTLAQEEAEAFNRDLVALSDVHQSLLACRTIEDVGRVVTEGVVEHFDGYFARLWLKRPGDVCSECAFAAQCPVHEECLHIVASAGHYTHLDGAHRRVPLGAFKIGRLAQGGASFTSNDVIHDERVHNRDWAKDHGLRSFTGFALTYEDEVRGVVAMFSRETISPSRQEVLELLAHATVSALVSVERLQATQKANRAKSDFLATMSHELRTPLNGVIGMMELLLREELPPRQRKYAWLAKSSGDTLLSLINDILDFSKIEAGKLELECIDFDLHYVVENVGVCFSSQAHSKGLELACGVHPDLPHGVRGDPGRLQQILTNLVSNALKFTQRGEIVVRAVKEFETEQDVTVRFTVSDSGIGIPRERVDRLFQTFSQVDASMSRRYGGTGLGLAICKRLVGMMGGEIGVESEPRRGSTFWFLIKLVKQAAAQTSSRMILDDIRRVRVLAVDDNATNREILHEQFESWDLDHVITPNAEESLRALRAAAAEGHPFGVAILDMQMPGMDGLQLGRAIKADPAIRETVLILLTSVDRIDESDEFVTAGFSGWLTKPVRQSQLLSAMADALACAKAGPVGSGRILQLDEPPAATWKAAKSCGARILLVEDHEISQEVASAILSRAGYSCEIKGNGKEAVDAVRSGRFDLVLMDCQMPEMDGFEATRLIRQQEEATKRRSDDATKGAGRVSPDAQRNDPLVRESLLAPNAAQAQWRTARTDGREAAAKSGTSDFDPTGGRRRRDRIPIIALTANAIKGDRERCLDAGMDDYISKPLDPERLIRLIETHLFEANDMQEESAGAAPGGDSIGEGGSQETRKALQSPDRGEGVSPDAANAQDEGQTSESVPWERPAFDADALLKRWGNDKAFVHTLVEKFKARAPEELERLKVAVNAQDAPELTRLAHGLKGAAGYVAAEKIREVAAALEAAGREGGLAECSRLVSKLEAELRRCCEWTERNASAPGHRKAEKANIESGASNA